VCVHVVGGALVLLDLGVEGCHQLKLLKVDEGLVLVDVVRIAVVDEGDVAQIHGCRRR
jgi:hypothetical protein